MEYSQDINKSDSSSSNNSKNSNINAKKYWSCEYLEGGLVFYESRICACAIHHHGTGEPCLMEYKGGKVSIEEIIAAKEAIIAKNQTTERHPNCRDCPYLVKRQWQHSEYPVNWLGISSWMGCNLKCIYCGLEWDESSPRRPDNKNKRPLMPYDVHDSIRDLLDFPWLPTISSVVVTSIPKLICKSGHHHGNYGRSLSF